MNISLTKEMEKYVEEKVASGTYATASEVVRHGLRLLQDADLVREAHREEIRKKIAEGLEQLERGEYVTPEELLAELRERRRKRERK
jgi:antitoxin ParD1/3/4